VPLETIPLVARASAHGSARALIDAASSLAYDELLARAAGAATALLAGASDLSGARVAFLSPPGIDYVLAQWGTFRAGGVAVPLCT
jgi:malonyl-CoA/methylmalonyl-CoA synthetase